MYWIFLIVGLIIFVLGNFNGWFLHKSKLFDGAYIVVHKIEDEDIQNCEALHIYYNKERFLSDCKLLGWKYDEIKDENERE